MDLGCGEGHAAHYFFKRGVAAMAVDGSRFNMTSQVFPILIHDLTVMPVVADVDLVWCQEVVEHIDEKYLWNLIESLSCGKVICMTHAEPDQPGYHHVNCQPATYWVEKLADAGYVLLEADTEKVRMLASSDAAHHAARSALVFGSKL